LSAVRSRGAIVGGGGQRDKWMGMAAKMAAVAAAATDVECSTTAKAALTVKRREAAVIAVAERALAATVLSATGGR